MAYAQFGAGDRPVEIITGSARTTYMISIKPHHFVDIVMALAKARWKSFEKIIDGVPTIIVENGRPLRDRMRKARVDEGDVMEAARRLQGIERMDQIRYAVLEVSGGITVIPREGE